VLAYIILLAPIYYFGRAMHDCTAGTGYSGSMYRIEIFYDKPVLDFWMAMNKIIDAVVDE